MNLKIRVQNVASLQDSGQFEVKPGLNCFVGVNNSGKTALLWAVAMLGCAVESNKSTWASILPAKMAGYRRGTSSPAVQIQFELPRAQRDQIVGYLCQLAGNSQRPAYEKAHETFEFNARCTPSAGVALVKPVRVLYNAGEVKLETDVLNLIGNNEYIIEHPFGASKPNPFSPEKFELIPKGVDNNQPHFLFKEPDKGLAKCWPEVLNSVFLLGGSREHTPRYSTRVGSTDLKPNAENLAQVLRTTIQTTRGFRRSREAFERIEAEVSRVFPEVKGLRVEGIPDPSGQDDQSEIVLDMRNGSTIPLSNCGTGLSQITTLLTAAHLKLSPSLFLIDEPHSNLHPSAEGLLVQILEALAKERGHIFCFATHSSIFANNCKNNLFAVVNKGDDSNVLYLSDSTELLGVLGITNFDLFTYDKLLFVEGDSDVRVFTLVLSVLGNTRTPDRIKIVDLSGDGKLRKTQGAHKLKRLLIEASASKAKVPVGFLLDSGGRSEQDVQDLRKVLEKPPESVLRLLKKPELENYLLEPVSVYEVLRRERRLHDIEEDPELARKITEIITGAPEEKGSSVLQKCYSASIVGREYRKRDDSPAIAAEILARTPSFLQPLYEELRSIVEHIGASSAAA